MQRISGLRSFRSRLPLCPSHRQRSRNTEADRDPRNLRSAKWSYATAERFRPQGLIQRQPLLCTFWFQTYCKDHTDENSATANSLTPLLRLPQEIKNHIYELVLGGNLLHIKWGKTAVERDVIHSTKEGVEDQRFTNEICCAETSEEDTQYYFNVEDGSTILVQDTELRHWNCNHSDHRDSSFAPHKMNINLLHTCRQIYNEARLIPYSTNTFSFDAPRNLRAFIHLLNQRKVNVNQVIRSLRIDLAYMDHDLHGWTQAFKAITRHMTLLERVFVSVDQRSDCPTSASTRQKKRAMWPVRKCLAALGKTPAQSIVIVLSDEYLSILSELCINPRPGESIRHRWTMEQKRLSGEGGVGESGQAVVRLTPRVIAGNQVE